MSGRPVQDVVGFWVGLDPCGCLAERHVASTHAAAIWSNRNRNALRCEYPCGTQTPHMHEESDSECTGVGIHQKLVPAIAHPQVHEDSESECTGVAVHHKPVPDTEQPQMHEESESASS